MVASQAMTRNYHLLERRAFPIGLIPYGGLGDVALPGIGFPAPVEAWRSYLEQQAPDMPTDFLLKWLQMESYGNPCSVGIPGVEAGIFQTYHPSDDRYGATFEQLRAPCIPGTQQAARPLTEAEKMQQVASGLGMVRAARSTAAAQLASVGSNWGQGSDFYTMVKQQHALPIVPIDLLPLFKNMNGRGPNSWAEFKDFALSTPPEAMPPGVRPWAMYPSTQGLQNRMADTLKNAEEAGAYAGGFLGVSGTAGSLLKLGLVAFIGYGVWKLLS